MNIEKIEGYCLEVLGGKENELPFHSAELIHQRMLFLKIKAVENDKLNTHFDLLNAAIWLEVTAYILAASNHGEKLLEIMKELGEEISSDLKTLIINFINQPKEGLLAELNLLYNFSVSSVENLKNRRIEKIQLGGKGFSDGAWIEDQFKKLEEVRKSELKFGANEVKQQEAAEMELKKMNLSYQKALSKEAAKEMHLDKEELKQLTKKLNKVEGVPERGIESWFRLTSKNLYVRLKIVDTKAGILITSNSLIISIVLGSLYTHLDEDPHLIYAVATLIITSTLSLVFAITASIPKLKNSSKEVTSDLMTFEYFHELSLQKYKEGIKEIMESGDVLYDSITTDIYQLGQKLNRKYRLISISFSVLLYGIIAAIVLFGMCHLMGENFM